MKSTSIKTVAVLTSGGDAPGLNAAIRALCVSGKNNYGMKFIGVRNGYRGLIDNDTFKQQHPNFDELVKLYEKDVVKHVTPYSNRMTEAIISRLSDQG